LWTYRRDLSIARVKDVQLLDTYQFVPLWYLLENCILDMSNAFSSICFFGGFPFAFVVLLSPFEKPDILVVLIKGIERLPGFANIDISFIYGVETC
jgi:hypothetical protein